MKNQNVKKQILGVPLSYKQIQMKKTFIILGLAAIISLCGCSKKNEITCIITSPKDGAEVSINDDLIITVDAKDTKGIIAVVTVYLDNLPYITTGENPYTATIPSILLTLGKQSIKALVIDKEGSQAENSISITITDKGGNNSDESPDFVTFADGKVPKSWRTNTWDIDVAMGYDDDYSLRTKDPVASVVTTKNINAESYIEFYIRGGNYFDFYINNVKAEAFSSAPMANNWTKWIYALEKGKHSFRWENTNGAIIHLDAIKFASVGLPKATTNTVTNIMATSATSGGNITDNGNSPVIARGVCWSTSQNPTIADNKTTDGTGTGSFTSNISDLTTHTIYYVRAYATNGAGTAYGEQVSFTTASLQMPTVTTANSTNITLVSATSGGNVTNEGYSSVTARGVCWSTSQNPTIADNKTTDGAGTGNFTSNITGLTQETTYYVRAYATNGVGTAYGEQKNFTTLSVNLPTVTTGSVTYFTSSTADCGGNVTNDGLSSVTARGVCWSNKQNPTINDNKTVNGSGTGSFTSNITGLNKGTIYYIRAYATNGAGTAYGNQVSFTINDEVNINGVIWANWNVDMPGTFATKWESTGMFYQWNRKIGWSSTNPMVNSNGGTTWDSSIPTGTTWTQANDPCPTGWRMPTKEELQSLLNSGYQWTTLKGINGNIFGNGNNTIFLPATGSRDLNNGALDYVGETGGSWSSSAGDYSYAYSLGFNTYYSDVGNCDRGYGLPVRCVKE